MVLSYRSIVTGCFVLLLLTGCDPKPASSPAGKSPNATAPTLPAPSEQPAAPEQARATATQPANTARDQQLIEEVEKAYASGVDNYRNGRLTEARRDFDHAVDLMLASGLDIKNDPQLSDEFEHTLDAVNTLEMEALKEGNGFSPKVEPAP